MTHEQSFNRNVLFILSQPTSSYLSIVDLCNVSSTCKELHQAGRNSDFWKLMLKAPSTNFAFLVQKAIDTHNYSALSPYGLLQLLSLGKIKTEDFTLHIVNLLKANENNPINHKILLLISDEMQKICKYNNITLVDFAKLDVDQLDSFFPLCANDSKLVRALPNLHPSNFISLTPLQIKAITQDSRFVQNMFEGDKFKPQDFSHLTPTQIKHIVYLSVLRDLYGFLEQYNFTIQDLTHLSEEHIDIISDSYSYPILKEKNISAEMLGKLTIPQLYMFFSSWDYQNSAKFGIDSDEEKLQENIEVLTSSSIENEEIPLIGE